MTNNIIYNWTFSTEKNRGELWHIIMFSGVIGLVIWGFFSGQYGMSFVILLITGLYLFMENNSEDNVTVTITELGINVGNKFYDYSRINSYTIIYEGPNASFMRLSLQKNTINKLDVKVDNTIVAELNKILPNFLEENPKIDMTFSEKLIRFLKL